MFSWVPGLSWDGAACAERQPVTLSIGPSGVLAHIEVPMAGSGKVFGSLATLLANSGANATTQDLVVVVAEAGRHLGPVLFQLGLAVGSRLEAHLLATAQASCQGAGPTGKKELATGVAHAVDRKSTRLNSSHSQQSRMPSSA